MPATAAFSDEALLTRDPLVELLRPQGPVAPAPLPPPPTRTKSFLQGLLRAKQLEREAPPLRGDDLRPRRLASGLPEIDRATGGGLPRGAVSECFGPASSGRTGTALAFAAHATREGALVAWVDPGDRFDPASAAEAGVDLDRLLWLRGGPTGGAPDRAVPGLPEAITALGVLAGSALFDLIVLDLAGVPAAAVQRLPAAAWIKLARAIEPTASAVLILGREHVAKSAPGVALPLAAATPRWSGSGPGRQLRGLDVRGPGLPPFHLAAAFD
ncbi:MAG: DNA recombination/repair protein RecA [Vicinamibacteria bacterium]|nr:DNA recombination/repair protein RecA [Vicinamibacteria bacterium]